MNRALLILLLLSGYFVTTARANTWQASRVWVVGTDDHAWVIGASDMADAALPVLQIWYAGNGAENKSPSLLPTLPPISGNPIAICADSEGLRVLFADLNQVDYFPNKPLAPGSLWKEECRRPPLAWSGDATKPIVWAVVAKEHLVEPMAPGAIDSDEDPRGEAAAESDLATDDAEKSALPVDPQRQPPSITVPPSSGHVLLMLERGVWSRHAITPAAENAERYWIASRDGLPRLFWQSGAQVLVSTRKQNADGITDWSEPTVVVASAVLRHAWTGDTKAGPIFVALVASSDAAAQVHVFTPDADGRWDRRAILRENLDYLAVDPLRVGVAIARGGIAMARIASGAEVEFAVIDVETWSPVRFEPLSLRRPEPTRPSRWQDSMALLVALSILTIVMWTRRMQLTTQLALPIGLLPSAVWRRIMATFLDFAPGALLMMPLALRAVPELADGADLASIREQLDDPAIQTKLLPFHYGSIIAYGLWCLVWEAIISTTPGKYLFGCRVISVLHRPSETMGAPDAPAIEESSSSESEEPIAVVGALRPSTLGERPQFRQLAVRNLCRIIMVSIGPPGWIITLMMMGMLSRNRQRVGDLMAGTMVVEEGVPIEDRAPDEPQDGQFG